MDLKNITSFEDFKILEKSIPDEFSNSTGFRQSLVGRALFGILRYFKKGIQLGKLEYYKRKLENEYFAALLRFCAYMGIDLKNPEEPSSKESPLAQGEEEPVGNEAKDAFEKEFCDVLGIDYTIGDYANKIAGIKNNFESYRNSIDTILQNLTDPTEKEEGEKMKSFAEQMIKCCDDKRAINDIFSLLVSSPVTGSTLTGYLTQISTFLSGPSAKSCSTYKGTINEKNFLRNLSGSTDPTVQAEISKILPLLESRNYLITEQITNSANKSIDIAQMLGDQLRLGSKASEKVNIHDYLNKIGITNVDEINFEKLAELFRAHSEWVTGPKSVSSENFTNYKGIRKIQYAASEIIFHVKPTPDYRGINPGEGGATQWNEDTSLRKTWEKKIEFVHSEFTGFFDWKLVDPFVLLNYKDAMRVRREGGGMYGESLKNEKGELEGIGDQVMMNNSTVSPKLGLQPWGDGDVKKEREVLIFTISYGEHVYYLAFALNSNADKHAQQVYRYIGIIDFHKIISDKIYEKPNFDRECFKYSSAIWNNDPRPDINKSFTDLLRIPPGTGNALNSPDGTHNFESIYMSSGSRFERIMSKKEETMGKSLRFLYSYVSGISTFGTVAGKNDFLLKFLHNSGNLVNVDLSNSVNNQTTALISVETGQIYTFLAGWAERYFPNGTITLNDYIRQPYLNEDPYDKKIKLV